MTETGKLRFPSNFYRVHAVQYYYIGYFVRRATKSILLRLLDKPIPLYSGATRDADLERLYVTVVGVYRQALIPERNQCTLPSDSRGEFNIRKGLDRTSNGKIGEYIRH